MTDFSMKRDFGPTPNYPRVKEFKRKQDVFFCLAGPCSVESDTQIRSIAKVVAAAGATHLRGGLFRAGTYPGQVFGLVEPTLIKAFYDAAKDCGLKTVIEILDYHPAMMEKIWNYADCFQIGCRSMQNYSLLKIAGMSGKPVFLKRSQGGTIDEFLGAAEHLLSAGCQNLCLIERGSSGTAKHVRWDLSISMIPAVKAITEIPILVDPSHGTGRRDLVIPMAKAGIAAGADGLLVEVHPAPEQSISDADQAIDFNSFNELMKQINIMRRLPK